MSKVKLNSANYDELEKHIQKAQEIIGETEDAWGENFDNLYQNFVDSGFLDALYEDAKSAYYSLKKGVSALTCTLSGAVLGLSFGPIGGIIGAVIGAIFGIFTAVKSDPIWITVSKETFEQLLSDCRVGNNDNYIKIINLSTKLYNIQVGLEKVKTLINEYNHTYANLEDAAAEFDLSTTLADDGMTVLSVDTEVTIDGKEVKVSVSEAMNAFFTYETSVMSAEIEADYLERTYGAEIDYNALVSNANSFMTSTLDSGLYTHEFVDQLLPSYDVDIDAAVSAGAENIGVSEDGMQSILSNVYDTNGDIGLFGGLLGSQFISAVLQSPSTTPATTTEPDTTPSTVAAEDPNATPGSGTTGGTVETGSSGGGSCCNNEDEQTTEPSTTPEATPEEQTTVELTAVTEDPIPEEFEATIDKDYDDLAREEYEAQGSEKISEIREYQMSEINKLIDEGKLDSIRSELSEYGYSEAEIDEIMTSRDDIITAVMLGRENKELAAIANKLASADGVNDFDTKYDNEPDIDDLSNGNASTTLVNMSDNKEVAAARTTFKKAEETYKNTITKANEAINTAKENEKTVADLKTKFTESYGADTSKWAAEAVKEYNAAVEKYNESVKTATAEKEKVAEAKKDYESAKEDYNDAKKEFLSEIKEKNEKDHSDSEDLSHEIVDTPNGLTDEEIVELAQE